MALTAAVYSWRSTCHHGGGADGGADGGGGMRGGCGGGGDGGGDGDGHSMRKVGARCHALVTLCRRYHVPPAALEPMGQPTLWSKVASPTFGSYADTADRSIVGERARAHARCEPQRAEQEAV